LSNVVFKVSEVGRQRVFKEKRKNAHAFAVGNILSLNGECPKGFNREVSYNPYKNPWFYFKKTSRKVESSPFVFCGNKTLFVLKGK
jgi:hypothetical protein